LFLKYPRVFSLCCCCCCICYLVAFRARYFIMIHLIVIVFYLHLHILYDTFPTIHSVKYILYTSASVYFENKQHQVHSIYISSSRGKIIPGIENSGKRLHVILLLKKTLIHRIHKDCCCVFFSK